MDLSHIGYEIGGIML